MLTDDQIRQAELDVMAESASREAKSRDEVRIFVRKHLGRRIRERRQQIGLTQAALSQMIGVSREALSQYETGRAGMDYADLPHLCSVLNVPLVWLFEEAVSPSQVAAGIDAIYNSLNEHDRQTLMVVAQSLYDRRGDVPRPEPRVAPFIHRRERDPKNAEEIIRRTGKVSKSARQSAGAGEGHKEEDAVAKTDTDVL